MEQNKEPRNRPIQNSQLIFDKGARAIQWRKDSFLNKWYCNNWTSICEGKKNLNTDLTPFTKINSKWIVDHNAKYKTVKLLENNIGENLDDIGFGDDSKSTMYERNN